MSRFRSRLAVSATAARVLWVALFAVGFAYVEAAVVVYLRELYYPQGFGFPLTLPPMRILAVELGREAATILMLVGVAAVAGKHLWERFGYFLLIFGVWDAFYYIWLKVTCDWPAGLLDWDLLFLLPVPWLAPVAAPVAVSIAMIAAGIWLISLHERAGRIAVPAGAWLAGIAATGTILYSFMYDTGAATAGRLPTPYPYGLLVAGLALYSLAGLFVNRAVGSQRQPQRR